MQTDPTRSQALLAQEDSSEGGRPTEAPKKFVKPQLTRHETLPRVTTGIAGGFTP